VRTGGGLFLVLGKEDPKKAYLRKRIVLIKKRGGKRREKIWLKTKTTG